MLPCTIYNRHWFTKYGHVGVRLKTCVRVGCQVENPRWDKYVMLDANGKGEIRNGEYWP